MKAPSLILIIFLVCMIIVLVVLEFLGTHNQRTSAQVMEKVIAQLTERSQTLETEIQHLRQQLTDQQDRMNAAAAASVPAISGASDSGTNEVPAAAAQPQSFQARAYVGNDYLGTAWVIPSKVRQNAETGELRFEPVIWIDEKSRKAFTQTNIVEREVVRNNSYNQTWSYQQPYWYGYPVWIQSKPDRPNLPPSQRPPMVQPLPQPGNVWAPVIGGQPVVKSAKPRITDSLGGTPY